MDSKLLSCCILSLLIGFFIRDIMSNIFVCDLFEGLRRGRATAEQTGNGPGTDANKSTIPSCPNKKIGHMTNDGKTIASVCTNVIGSDSNREPTCAKDCSSCYQVYNGVAKKCRHATVHDHGRGANARTRCIAGKVCSESQ